MADEKMCPLLAMGLSAAGAIELSKCMSVPDAQAAIACRREACAWWVGDRECLSATGRSYYEPANACAIAVLAQRAK